MLLLQEFLVHADVNEVYNYRIPCRQKLNPTVHPITRITDVNTLYDYLEEATGSRTAQ